MRSSKAQIIATIGPASSAYETLSGMAKSGMDIARLNFSWADFETRASQIELIRKIEGDLGRKIPIIEDLPGSRIQQDGSHTYNKLAPSSLTAKDVSFIEFGARQKIDYVALSFVGGAGDIILCREAIAKSQGRQKIIAKIERSLALQNLDEIIKVSDAVMIARGDLGNEIPLESIPFVQSDIIKKSKKAGKSVIVATQMLLSMVNETLPSRAEVTDVANAILQGADAVMLSEETAIGRYPIETVKMMEKISQEAEKHTDFSLHINCL